jgi:hypothetical protein
MDDPAKLRARLADTWQKAARDFRAAGAPAETVFGTLLAAGLAGLVETHGKRGATKILLQLAETIDREASDEAAAIRQATAEASRATRN